MNRLRAILVVCGVLSAVPAFGASPDPKDLAVSPQELSKARELVRRLGSDVYREREEAQTELTKMGRRAKQAITEGATADPDPEVRLRCGRLLPKALADDLKARIETFLADTDGKFKHNLPGLKLFITYVGHANEGGLYAEITRAPNNLDKDGRALYAEILKSPHNLDMFAALDKGFVAGGRAISDRRATLWNDMNNRQFVPGGRPFTPRQPTLGDIAALLFAESVVPGENIPRTGANWAWVNGTQFLQQSASYTALNNSNTPHAAVYKRIVAKWLISRTDPQELNNLVYQLGSNLKQFPESLIVLRRIVLTDGVAGYSKGQALMHLTQQRPKEEAKFLREILRNELRVGDYPGLFPAEKNPNKMIGLNHDMMVQQVWFQRGNMAEMHSCLLKDVALAFLISQAGLNIKDYGFETQPGVIIQPNQLGYGNYAFTTEEARATAFVKFGWYQMKESMKKAEKGPRGTEPAPPVPTPTPPTTGGPGPIPKR